MSEAPNTDETARTVNAVVATCRAKCFEYLSLMILSDGLPANDDLKRDLQSITLHFENAKSLLRNEVPQLFAQLGIPASDELHDQIFQALRTIDSLQSLLNDLNSSQGSAPGKLDRFLPVLEHCRNDLWNKITTFIEAFNAHIASANRKQAQDEAVFVRKAMNEIDEISDSINLISINASVEAARAGYAGRGFAVIAEEIQTLSKRSRTSLRSIKDRIA